jgi:GlcNAc-P-P-Und epimerase
MNLLLTGASGFLGCNILPILEKQYSVYPFNHIQLSNLTHLNRHYNIVLHLAGLAHVKSKGQFALNKFLDNNYYSTYFLCYLLEHNLPEQFVYISSASVYGLSEGEDINEESPLLGNTPYALSKIITEQFLIKWSYDRGVKLVILRPPLIVGKNPKGNLKSMIDGINNYRYLSIGGGKARKSMLMADDIGRIIPLLDNKEGIYNLCDTYSPSFREMETLISHQLGRVVPKSIPLFLSNLLIGKEKSNKMAKTLTFSNEKARKQLGWTPLSVLDNFKI